MPAVSVVIPTYNCADYLNCSIDSVLAQTFQDFEIILVDDGSTDNTRSVVEGIDTGGRLKYVFQGNSGVAAARSKGIQEASGKYIAYVDADDEWEPNLLETCLRRIEEDGADWCVCDLRMVNIVNGERSEHIDRVSIPEGSPLHGILKYDFMIRTPFFKRQALLDAGLYDHSMLTREDWDMNIRLVRLGKKISYIPQALYHYKYRGDSLMRKTKRVSLDCTFNLLKKHHKQIADSGDMVVARIYAEHMWWLGRDYWVVEKDFLMLVKCVSQSLFYDFDLKKIVRPVLNKLGLGRVVG